MKSSFLASCKPHYAELRARLVRTLVVVFLWSIAAYFFKDTLTAWCMRPLKEGYPEVGKLVYTNLPEALFSYLKLSFAVGCLMGFPWALGETWLFVKPALFEREKRLAFKLLPLGVALFFSGACFAFFVALPFGLRCLMSYAGPNLLPMLRLGQYLGFIARMALTFALAFEIPFLMVVAVRLGLAGRAYLRGRRLYAYGVMVMLAFLLTAGDATATALLTLPFMALYETGLLACRVFGGRETLESQQ